MELALATRGLSRRLGRAFAVQGVSLSVPRGAVYGLLGPNGAGKTSVLRLVLDLLRPDSGEVEVLGMNARRHPARARARVGYVPERPVFGVPGWMSVRRAIRYHAAFYTDWDAAHAAALLGRLRIPERQSLGRLSKGEAARLSFLLALAHRPPLLLLDEPTDGLDPVARHDFMELLLEHVADTGATVLVSSHLVHELERVADWVGVMDGGRLISELPMERFRGSVKRLRVAPGGPADLHGLPVTVLSRATHGREEVWAVAGWDPAAAAALGERGVELREVVDLSLEESYVELLKGRSPAEVAHVR